MEKTSSEDALDWFFYTEMQEVYGALMIILIINRIDNIEIMKYIRNILNTKLLEDGMSKKLKIADIGAECVACGCCVTVCPREAVQIQAGVKALVDGEKCIGCGKCAKICPADVITITERRIGA